MYNSNDTKAIPAKDSLLPAPLPDSTQTETELSYIHTFTDSALEDRITKALLKLPFVKKSNAYSIRSAITSTALRSCSTVWKRRDRYLCTGGLNGDMRFETYLLFLC